jgi:hypothetical protein
VPGPELGGEAARAGLWTAIGILKLAESLLRRADRRHRDVLEDIDTSFHTGAIIREELRKENDLLRQRRASAEVEIHRLTTLCDEMQRTIESEKRNRELAQAELKLLKAGRRVVTSVEMPETKQEKPPGPKPEGGGG